MNDGTSIGEIARWLTERGVPTPTGKAVWDRSSVWGMLRNTAYRGQAALGKTKTLERHGKPTRTTRPRRASRPPSRTKDHPAEKWTLIPVPPLVGDVEARGSPCPQRALRQAQHQEPTLLQSFLVCREWGSAAIAARPARRTNGSTTTSTSALTTTATSAMASFG